MLDLGSQIRSRRAAFALTVESVAKLAHLSPERLASIESGELPSTRELSAIAEALACDPASIAQGRVDDPRWSVARFRSGEGAARLSAHDLRLLARAAEASRILAALWQALEAGPSQVASLRRVCGPSRAMEPWQHGYELGAKARKALSPEHAPVESMQGLLETMGVHVAHVEFETEEIEAASLFELGAAPVILVNKRAPKYVYPLARRSVLAHELCHLLHDGGKRDLTIVTRENDPGAVEQRANGFAPSFLAPGDWVESAGRGSKQPRQIVAELARTWGLSFEGAAWHAKNLRLIPPDAAERLARGPKPPLRSDFEPPLPRTPPEQLGIDADPSELSAGLLAETAIQACADELISRARAAEILSLR